MDQTLSGGFACVVVVVQSHGSRFNIHFRTCALAVVVFENGCVLFVERVLLFVCLCVLIVLSGSAKWTAVLPVQARPLYLVKDKSVGDQHQLS